MASMINFHLDFNNAGICIHLVMSETGSSRHLRAQLAYFPHTMSFKNIIIGFWFLWFFINKLHLVSLHKLGIVVLLIH